MASKASLEFLKRALIESEAIASGAKSGVPTMASVKRLQVLIMEEQKATLKKTGELRIPGIGRLKLQEVPERTYRGPMIGEGKEVTKPAHMKAIFKHGRDLKSFLNDGKDLKAVPNK